MMLLLWLNYIDVPEDASSIVLFVLKKYLSTVWQVIVFCNLDVVVWTLLKLLLCIWCDMSGYFFLKLCFIFRDDILIVVSNKQP